MTKKEFAAKMKPHNRATLVSLYKEEGGTALVDDTMTRERLVGLFWDRLKEKQKELRDAEKLKKLQDEAPADVADDDPVGLHPLKKPDSYEALKRNERIYGGILDEKVSGDDLIVVTGHGQKWVFPA